MLKRIIVVMFVSSACWAWNPVTDLRENVVWTFGKTAEMGTAMKIAGAGDLKSTELANSALMGIADYRFLTLSYGGTIIDRDGTQFTDTAKIGFRLNKFFDWFKNPITPEMEFLRNINIGPSFAMPLFTEPHAGALFVDFNYRFGSAGSVAK